MGRRSIGSIGELVALVREDYETHNRSYCPGFRAIAIHRFGAWTRGLKLRLTRAPLSLVYRLWQRRMKDVIGVELDPRAEIGRRLFIGHQGAIVVGPKVRIGDDVTLLQGVTIGKTGNPRKDVGRPVIGDRVNIGVGAVIIGPIVVGHDSLIGPNVVVQKDVPPFSAVLPPEPTIRQRSEAREEPTLRLAQEQLREAAQLAKPADSPIH